MSPERITRRSGPFWPRGLGLALSLAAHAALIPLIRAAWVSMPATPPEPPAVEVTLVWAQAETEAQAPEQPPAASPAPAPAMAAPPPPEEAPAPPQQPPPAPSAPPAATVPAEPPAAPRHAPAPARHRTAQASRRALPPTSPAAPESVPAEPPAVASLSPASPPAAAVQRSPPPDREATASARAGVLAAYSRSLFDRLDRYKIYPRSSQRRGEEGTITVRLTLSKDGQLIGVVPLGSGPGNLVEASLAAVQAAAPFPPLPDELGTQEASFTVPIVYRLQ